MFAGKQDGHGEMNALHKPDADIQDEACNWEDKDACNQEVVCNWAHSYNGEDKDNNQQEAYQEPVFCGLELPFSFLVCPYSS